MRARDVTGKRDPFHLEQIAEGEQVDPVIGHVEACLRGHALFVEGRHAIAEPRGAAIGVGARVGHRQHFGRPANVAA